MIDNDDIVFLFKAPPRNACSRFEQVNVSIILVCGITLVLKVFFIYAYVRNHEIVVNIVPAPNDDGSLKQFDVPIVTNQ